MLASLGIYFAGRSTAINCTICCRMRIELPVTHYAEVSQRIYIIGHFVSAAMVLTI